MPLKLKSTKNLEKCKGHLVKLLKYFLDQTNAMSQLVKILLIFLSTMFNSEVGPNTFKHRNEIKGTSRLGISRGSTVGI